MKTNSTSQIPRTLTRKAILLAITALALSAAPDSRAAAECLHPTSWTGMIDTNWFTSGNWTNGVPNCNPSETEALINSSVAAQINFPNATACALTLGPNSGDSGQLFVSSGTLETCTETLVGSQGTGNLSITNGGRVTTDLNAAIASQTASNGAVTVDGTNSAWTVDGELDIGGTTTAAGGTGLLTVTNSGTVTAASVHAWKSGTLTGNGTVNISSTGSSVTIDGTLKPSGQLTIGGIGGNLTFNGIGASMQSNVVPASADNVDVSGMASLNGKLSVTMTGTFTCATTRYTLLYAAGGRSLSHPQFAGVSITYPTNQGFIPQIDYVGDYVYLDLVFNNGCH